MNRLLSSLTSGLGLAVALAFPATSPAAPSPEEPAAVTLPAQELTARTLYTFLLAEIAGARGEIGVAVQAYADLAQRTRDPRIARRAMEIALYARNMPAAIDAARIWSEADPSSEEARRILAGLLAGGDGQLEQVQAQLARLLAQSPENIDNHLMGLNRAFSRVQDKEAVKGIVMRLTEPYTSHPEAYFARAQAAISAGDAMESVAAIDTALRMRPDWEPAILFKAQLLSQSGAMQEAMRIVTDYLQRHPDSRNARLAHARALVSTKQFEAARQEFRQLLDGAPDDRELMYAVGLLSAQLEDYDTAATQLERALNAGHPDDDSIRINLGQVAERRKDSATALRWYRAVEPGPQHLDAQLRIASILARDGKVAEAREHLHNVKTADEADRKRLLLGEAQILRTAGKEAEAFELVDGALRSNEDDTDLLYESSMLAESLGKLEVMEGRLRKLIALRPEFAHAYNALGYSFADRGVRLEEAEALIVRALELTPDDPFILDSMGWVRFRRNDPTGALAHLEKAYGLRQDPEIAAHLGEVLWNLKRPADASRVWDEALKNNPDNDALKSVVKRLRGQ
ncbi:tetratricopeptide repeat protein [Aromatoleum toluvorans]|uniref:Tetratricopeptide repeat protein n=1 Tax=Aromatoleum toluvorans TaxID=92002 RepID=A0ABX1PYN4_9RHOO|nr:tetratricopeptide repeat protein [Aromatoleum toluvorans]NMG43586.1 tetratricopeptide repeat protein [Aromatoleum toluvorans]